MGEVAADEVRTVTPDAWVAAVRAAVDEGWSHFDWLGAVDELGRSDELRVVVRLLDPRTAAGLRLQCAVPRDEPRLDSLGDVLAGARWAERETRDLFGVEFTGGDDRPLLVADASCPGDLAERPLRKDAVLGARALPWPGAADDADTTRRRLPPPGVLDPDVFGARPADAGPLDPAAVVAPTRRRRR